MDIDIFDYTLPTELIAQSPVTPRDHSRCLVYTRATQQLQHQHFFDLPELLGPEDIIVCNNTKVFPARLSAQKTTGGAVEVFLLHQVSDTRWQALLRAKNAKPGLQLLFPDNCTAVVVQQIKPATEQLPVWEIEFSLAAEAVWRFIYQYGQAPLPPYITTPHRLDEYQTVFAAAEGSVAASTAGFHFTTELQTALQAVGVQFEYITLHVGMGTFAPIKTADITKHIMHAEWAQVTDDVAQRLNTAKQAGKRIIAVGTTTTRTLETFAQQGSELRAQSGWIDTYIYPGYTYSYVDGLVTNFHLPKSTLLLLVAAFLAQGGTAQQGIQRLHYLYQCAIEQQYRFYSYGDGMLLL